MDRKAYLSDVSDDEWAFVAPYLTLMREDAPQREYPLREVFNGLRYIVVCVNDFDTTPLPVSGGIGPPPCLAGSGTLRW